MSKQKFLQFKESITPQQFNNSKFLNKKAKELLVLEPDLALLILQRVRNLEKQQASRLAKIKKLKQVKSNELHMHSSENITDLMVLSEQTQKPNKIFVKPENKKVGVSANSKLDKAKNKNVKKPMKIRFKFFISPFMLFVVWPSLIFSFYQIVWATGRFESRTQLVVQQPDGMATMDASMAILSGLGVNTANTDTQLVKAYIYSNDMLNYLEIKLGLRDHYSKVDIDYFSRLHDWDTQEDVMAFYQQHVLVEIDESSSVITVYAQAFDEKFAQELAVTIANKAEWFINDIGHQLANAQLSFIQGEHELVEKRLQKSQLSLLTFQQQHKLLNPEEEGSALAQITYGMEGQIASKKAELKALQSIMSSTAPQVKSIINQLKALQRQLEIEKQRLTKVDENLGNITSTEDKLSVSEVLAKFTDLKIESELALNGFTSSTISLEKSRIEAYRKLKYLIVVEQATRPEDISYPTVFYNISLLIIMLLLIYGIGRIVTTTINELK